MSRFVLRSAMGLALAASVCLGTAAGTREDLARLDQQVATLNQRVQALESQMATLQMTVKELSSKLEVLSRSAQTADLRLDLEQMKVRLEAVSSQIDAIKAQRESLAAPPVAAPMPEPQGNPAPIGAEPPGAEISPSPEGAPPAAPSPGISADLYTQAYNDYLQGRYEQAAAEFAQFMNAFPTDPRAANSQYWIGECLYSRKQFSEAKAAFQAVLDRFPKSTKTQAASLKLGLSHLALDETAQGIAVLKKLIQEAPNSDEALIARDRLARLQAP